MDATVHEATPEDVDDLLELWNAFADHLSRFNERYRAKRDANDRWRSYFDNQVMNSKYATVLLAEDGSGEPVGVIEVRIVGEHPIFQVDRHGEVYGLFVAEDVRGTGVGRALLDAAAAWLDEEPRGVDFYRIDVVEGDEEAAKALRSLGLTPVTHTFEGQT